MRHSLSHHASSSACSCGKSIRRHILYTLGRSLPGFHNGVFRLSQDTLFSHGQIPPNDPPNTGKFRFKQIVPQVERLAWSAPPRDPSGFQVQVDDFVAAICERWAAKQEHGHLGGLE